MAAPPSELPEWGTDGGASIVTPSLGSRQLGYVANTAALAGVMNWVLNLIYQWVLWIKVDSGAAQREANYLVNSEAPVTILSSPNLMRGFTCLPTGRIIGCGDGGVLRTSDDGGATWTSRTPAASYTLNFNDVQYFSGFDLFAVGQNGEIQTAGLGVTWTHRTSGTSAELVRIGWDGNTRIIAIGNTGVTVISTDGGATWSAGGVINSGDFSPSGLCFANGVWLATGLATTPTRDNSLFISTNNGTTWTPITLSSGSLLVSGERCGGVSQVQGTFVALVGGPSTNPRTIVSKNGTTWLSGGTTIASTPMALACGSHVMALLPTTPLGIGVMSYDCGATWFQLLSLGFGNCRRIQMLSYSGSISGTRKWIACGDNLAADDRGKVSFSKFFAV